MRLVAGVPGLKGINDAQRLYVTPCGSGVSCLGFDVCARWTAAYADFANRPDLQPSGDVGTIGAFERYQAAHAAALAHYTATGKRCEAFLTPELKGLEGRRVKVTTPAGDVSRFWVGKSTGWAPIHLEIPRRDSSGGGGAYVPAGSRVEVVGSERRQ